MGENPTGYPVGAVCNVVYWPERDAILLIKKQPHKFDGNKWGCTGGKQEFGETSEAAAWREMREEGGPWLNPDNLAYSGIVGVEDDIIPEIRKHYICAFHLFLVRPGLTPSVVNAEPEHHSAIRFFSTGYLPGNCTRAFRKVVAKLHRDGGLSTPDVIKFVGWRIVENPR